MSTIDNFELPESIVTAMKQNVTDMEPEEVLAFARSYPSWSKGFRLIKKNVEPFRQRILDTMFSDGKEIPEALLKFFSFNDLNLGLISKLPPESLELFLYDFQEYFGEEQYLICLLLDKREEVRKLAVQCLEGGEDGEEYEKNQEEAEEQQGNDAEHDNNLKELKKLRGEAKRETAIALKRNKRLEEKIEKLKNNLSEQQDLFVLQKEKVDRKHQLVVTTQNKLDNLTIELQDKIQEGITAEIRKSISTWLAYPLEINKLIESDETDFLLSRVEQALEHQAHVDKHSGNLRILKERLGTLEQAKVNIDQARKESLKVIPELAKLSCELGEEIIAIQQKIGSCPEENSQLAPWLVKINEAASSRELQSIDRLIKELHEQDIFKNHDVQILRQQIRRVRDRFIDQWKYVESESESSTLQHILIVDGHNVVLGQDSFYLFNSQNNKLTEPEKRKLLTGMNTKAFGGKQNVTVMIYFDSPTSSQNKVTPNIKEIFSGGGQEDQRADNAIIDFLQNRKNDSLTNKYILITDDRDLSSRAEKLGAEVLSVFEYGVMLRQ